MEKKYSPEQVKSNTGIPVFQPAQQRNNNSNQGGPNRTTVKTISPKSDTGPFFSSSTPRDGLQGTSPQTMRNNTGRAPGK